MNPEPLTRETCERMARIARVLIAAAFKNEDVKHYLRDLSGPAAGLWTPEIVKAGPPVKLEFEHAFVIGGLGESFSAANNKPTFGEFIGVFPVAPDDPVDPCRILYVYKASSPYNRRVEQRRTMKKRLGKGWRSLVGQAMGENKGQFLKRYATPDAIHMIRQTLGLDPGRFWRAVRGKEWLDLAPQWRQLELFDTTEEPTT